MQKWQTIRTSVLRRHVHTRAYAALVLSGEYDEAGDLGRFKVRAGDVVFHDRFEGHLNRFATEGAVVLNLRLSPAFGCAPGIASVADPDGVARLAEQHRPEALQLLLSSATRRTSSPQDWPDELAAAMIDDPCLRLSQWADENGL